MGEKEKMEMETEKEKTDGEQDTARKKERLYFMVRVYSLSFILSIRV